MKIKGDSDLKSPYRKIKQAGISKDEGGTRQVTQSDLSRYKDLPNLWESIYAAGRSQTAGCRLLRRMQANFKLKIPLHAGCATYRSGGGH